MQTTAIMVWAYGVLVAVGGVIGCAKVRQQVAELGNAGDLLQPVDARRGGLELTS
jgi:hypothetical protein